MFNYKYIYLLSFFIVLPLFFYWNLTGYDIWWHLKSAEYLVNTGTFPTPDIYSFTAEGKHWNQHSWLGALVYYLFFQIFGEYGLTYLTIFIKVLTVLAGYFFSYRILKSFSLSFLFTLCVAVSIHFMVPRPHVFSPLFSIPYLMLIIDIYNNVQARNTYWKSIVLFLLSIFWVNIHGEFIVGVFMSLSAIIAEIIYCIITKEKFRNSLITYILLPSIFGFIINPHGIFGIIYPINAQSNPSLDWNSLIIFSSNSNVTPIEIFLYSVLLVLFIIVIYYMIFNHKIMYLLSNYKSKYYLFMLISIFSMYLAISYIRMTCLLIFPILFLLYIISKNIRLNNYDNICSFVLVILFIAIFQFRVLQAYPFHYPIQTFQFIDNVKLKGNLFCPLTWSGKFIYKYEPDIKVFIDGRLQLYQGKIFDDYLSILNGEKESLFLLDRYKCDIVILPHEDSNIINFIKSDKWKRIFSSLNDSIFLSKIDNEDNWNNIIRYYKSHGIIVNREDEFFLVQAITQNPKWVYENTNIDEESLHGLVDIIKYLFDEYDQFRPNERRHKAYENLADRLYNIGFYYDSSIHYEIACSLENSCLKSRYNYIKSLMKIGDFQTAKPIIKEMLANDQYNLTLKKYYDFINDQYF